MPHSITALNGPILYFNGPFSSEIWEGEFFLILEDLNELKIIHSNVMRGRIMYSVSLMMGPTHSLLPQVTLMTNDDLLYSVISIIYEPWPGEASWLMFIFIMHGLITGKPSLINTTCQLRILLAWGTGRLHTCIASDTASQE